jgi:hypothetical protein
MAWSERWLIPDPPLAITPRAVAAALGAALEARGLALGPCVVHEDGAVEGARVEAQGPYVQVDVGLGALQGSFTIARGEAPSEVAAADDAPPGWPAYAEIVCEGQGASWEPLYLLFAEVALALGAVQEPALPTSGIAAGSARGGGDAAGAEEASDTDAQEAAALREDVRAVVEACAADALDAEGLAAADAVVAAVGAAPLDAIHVALAVAPAGIAVRVTGAGEVLEVAIPGAGAGALSAAGRARLEQAVAEDLGARLRYYRALRHERAAPPADPALGGQLALVRRAAGIAAPLTSIDALRAALLEDDVDVIRYLADGAPLWKAAYARGHALDAQIVDLDDLHGERTWQWDARAR